MSNLSASKIFLSVVIPVFRCGPCLDPLYERLSIVLQSIGRRYEIIFVNDCSPDDSADILSRLSARDSQVVVHHLAKNGGQYFAVATGLSLCQGDLAIVMDGDLEHPPEAIPSLVEASLQGYDIVLAARSKQVRPFARHLASRLLRRIVAPYRHFPNHHDYGMFSALSRRALLNYLRFPDAGHGYLVILDRLPFPYQVVLYRPEKRFAGRSSYGPMRLIRSALSTVRCRWLASAQHQSS